MQILYRLKGDIESAANYEELYQSFVATLQSHGELLEEFPNPRESILRGMPQVPASPDHNYNSTSVMPKKPEIKPQPTLPKEFDLAACLALIT